MHARTEGGGIECRYGLACSTSRVGLAGFGVGNQLVEQGLIGVVGNASEGGPGICSKSSPPGLARNTDDERCTELALDFLVADCREPDLGIVGQLVGRDDRCLAAGGVRATCRLRTETADEVRLLEIIEARHELLRVI